MATRANRYEKSEKDHSQLAQCFSQDMLVSLSQGKLNGNLSKALRSQPLVGDDSTLADWFDAAFKILTRSYRCEYVYKNTLARKIVLGRHSPRTCTFLSEVRVGQHVADAVVLNGTSTVYEIKSEYDSFERLAAQLEAYQQMFDRVVVVCPEGRIDKAAKLVPPSTGLIALTAKLGLSVIREPSSNLERLVPDFIFPTFRKAEYVSIADRFGTPVNVPNSELFGLCRRTFNSLAPAEAHAEMLFQLKKRGPLTTSRAALKSWLPESLTGTFLSSPISLAGTSTLGQCLKRSVLEWRTIVERTILLPVLSSQGI